MPDINNGARDEVTGIANRTPLEGPPRPEPPGEGLFKAYYEYLGRGELRLQRCIACRNWCHPPREMCPKCSSSDLEWERVSGRGRIFTWTTVHRALHAAFVHRVPYAAVVVELEEGPRLITEIVETPLDALEIDLPVSLRLLRLGKQTVPVFAVRTPGEKS